MITVRKILPWVLSLALVFTLPVAFPANAYAAPPPPTSIFVDAADGLDTNDGLTEDSSVQSLSKAFSLANTAGYFYQILLEEGNYPSPGMVNLPASATVSVMPATTSAIVTVFRNPGLSGVSNLIDLRYDTFSSLSFSDITFTGDDPATAGVTETAGTGIYLYSCDTAGNTVAFDGCTFENLQNGIYQEYTENISILVDNCEIRAARPIHMDDGRNLTVANSLLELSQGVSTDSIINLNGGSIEVQITGSTLKGYNGQGRGIYEDPYSGQISGNHFLDLSVAVEASDIHTLLISDNIIETSFMGLDLESYFSTCSISAINNTILNKGLKSSGAVGIELDANSNTLAGSFVVQENKIVNFYRGLDYTDTSSSTISFTLGGAGLENSFWGNVVNVDWHSSIPQPVDFRGNDWGTTSLAEAYGRLYANVTSPAAAFLLDDPLTSHMPATVYVDDNFSPASAGGHTYGVDAFSSILDALGYTASGGEILVANGSYTAPVWIDRPVHITGMGTGVNLSKHGSLTASDSEMTTVSAPDVSLENLNFSNGDYGVVLKSIPIPGNTTYPDRYKILDCTFTDFDYTAIYEPTYTEHTASGTCEISGNQIARDQDVINGSAVYIECKNDLLKFNDNTISGDYYSGIYLVGRDMEVQNNNISLEPSYNGSGMGIQNSGDLLCADNTITTSSIYIADNQSTGVYLSFTDASGHSGKEFYRNRIHGFNKGILLNGSEASDLFTVTLGGVNANANDFSGNQVGLVSSLFNYGGESTNATYNLWGKSEDQLPGYIYDYVYNPGYYGPVTYLPVGQTEFAGGTGTPENPYQISTPEHLDNVRNYLGSENSAKYFLLINDINLGINPWNSGDGWVPIGSYENQFFGKLDGGSHSIAGMKMLSTNNYLGLFSHLGSTGEVKNMTMSGIQLRGHGSFGAIAGRNNGSIDNCTVTGNINGTGNNIGGLVGENAGTLTRINTSVAAVGTLLQTGGIVGYNFGTVSDCHSSGSVSGYWYNGGIAGVNSGAMTNSHSTGPVAGTRYSGGIAGENNNTITSCSAIGTVTTSDDTAGGLAAYNRGTISGSFASGNVTGKSELGGLIGVHNGTLVNSYSMGNATGTGNSIGGLVGIITGGTVSDCYSIGAVTGSNQLGGTTGANYGTITRTFYNSDTVNQTDTNTGMPMTTTQLKALSTYNGWGFPAVWTLSPTENNGYPALQWQGFTHRTEPGSSSGGGGSSPALPEITIVAGKTSEGTNILEATLPALQLKRILQETNPVFHMPSPFITLDFDQKAIEVIYETSEGDTLRIVAEETDKSTLSPSDLLKVQGRPVYEFSVWRGSEKITDFKDGQVTVHIPYTLLPGENPNAVVVYYLESNGNLKLVNGFYDAATKSILFKTSHFSHFSIGYNPVNFMDVQSGDWYKAAVDFIGARGITSGIRAGVFGPETKLTRAQFIVLMMNAYQIEVKDMAASSTVENFSDAGEDYYTSYLLKAKEMGLTAGVGDNMFAPKRQITRQEMFVMLYNTLDSLGVLTASTQSGDPIFFQDSGQLAPWAEEATQALTQRKIIAGDNGRLNPEGTATRAEMSQLLFNLLSK